MQNATKSKNQLLIPLLLIIAIAMPIIAQLVGFSYALTVGSFMLIYIISVSGLDIMFGYCGQISLGHAAFYAIGAYASGIIHNATNLPVILTMFIGAAIAAIVGGLLAYPASKLVFHFLTLATIAFGEIVFQLITNSPGNITGNVQGMRSDPISFLGFKFDSNLKFYYIALIFVIIFLIAKTFIVNSKVGRAFIAIRENTHAADGMGIDVRKYKIIAFAMSAFFTAFAGAMYMHHVRYISPDSFMQKQSILLMTMLMFGGSGSLLGPIIGVAFIQLLTESLRSFQDYQMLIYGVLMLIVIIFIPGGLYGTFKKIFGNKKIKSEDKGVKQHA